MLRKSKNQAKTVEDRSKSHFSHIRKEIKKVTVRPLILERFSYLKIDPRSRKDVFEIIPKINSSFGHMFYRFGLHFGPPGLPKNSRIFMSFCSWCHSWATPKALQDGSRIRFVFHLVPFWHQISKNFLWFSTNS